MLKRIYRLLHPRYQTLHLDYKLDQKPRYGHGLAPHSRLYDIIAQDVDTYKNHLLGIVDQADRIWKIGDNTGSKFRWQNGFLPGLDIAALYSMLVRYKPRKYLEIGSGYSSLIIHRARMDHEIDVRMTSIDPQPRAETRDVFDEVIRRPVEEVDLQVIDQLESGDIIFVDNSHRILPNSDSTVFFLDILPRLRPGVIVHLHDIYLPYDYPQFMCDRYYSEQYGLAIALLTDPKKYKLLLPNYFVSKDSSLSSLLDPLWHHSKAVDVERHGGSFWMQVE